MSLDVFIVAHHRNSDCCVLLLSILISNSWCELVSFVNALLWWMDLFGVSCWEVALCPSNGTTLEVSVFTLTCVFVDPQTKSNTSGNYLLHLLLLSWFILIVSERLKRLDPETEWLLHADEGITKARAELGHRTELKDQSDWFECFRLSVSL